MRCRVRGGGVCFVPMFVAAGGAFYLAFDHGQEGCWHLRFARAPRLFLRAILWMVGLAVVTMGGLVTCAFREIGDFESLGFGCGAMGGLIIGPTIVATAEAHPAPG